MAASWPPADARRGAAGRLHTEFRAPGRRRFAAVTGLAAAISAAVLAGCGQVPADADSTVSGTQPPTPVVSATAAAPTISGPAATASPTPSPSPTVTRPSASSHGPTARPSTVPSATEKAILAAGDHGPLVRELQARLQQLDWYAGEITEHYGPATTAAVEGFQGRRKLPVTGTVDQTTWTKLVAMTRHPTQAELSNVRPAGPAILEPGDSGRRVKELQARLKQLDWFAGNITGYYGDVTGAAVRGFQAKRSLPATGEVDQRTWDTLLGMTDQPTAAELSGSGVTGVAVGNLDQRCLTGRALCIDKTTMQLVWVIDGKPQLRFDVRFGADTTPTREGSFSVGWKARDWVSTIYHSEMPYSMFFSGGQAVHYSSDFAARGYAGASHGCVNVRDLAGIRSLFDQVSVGDKVIVYRSQG